MHPYKARRISPLPQREVNGWRIKRYSVCHADQQFDERRFDGGVGLALTTLPAPAVSVERPGVGFLVMHQGNGVDYAVLAWWDRENELPLRVFVCDRPGTNEWRPARDSESVCVWDLQVVWAEREAYVRTILSENMPDAVDAYLAQAFSQSA